MINNTICYIRFDSEITSLDNLDVSEREIQITSLDTSTPYVPQDKNEKNRPTLKYTWILKLKEYFFIGTLNIIIIINSATSPTARYRRPSFCAPPISLIPVRPAMFTMSSAPLRAGRPNLYLKATFKFRVSFQHLVRLTAILKIDHQSA